MLRYYIVRRGEVVPTTDFDTGPLVYRNDELFFRFQRWVVGLMVLMVCLAIVLAILYLHLYLSGGYGTLGLFFPIVWSVVVALYIWQIHDWRQFKYGIGFHQKGIDIIKFGPYRTGRLFVPTKEIFKTRKSFLRLNIEARFSND